MLEGSQLKKGSEKLVSRDYKAGSLLFLQGLLDDIFNFTDNGYALIFLRYDASLSIALPRHGNPQIFRIKDQLPTSNSLYIAHFIFFLFSICNLLNSHRNNINIVLVNFFFTIFFHFLDRISHLYILCSEFVVIDFFFSSTQ